MIAKVWQKIMIILRRNEETFEESLKIREREVWRVSDRSTLSDNSRGRSNELLLKVLTPTK